MKYYYFAVKIYDSLRTGTEGANPLYVSTFSGIMLDEIECLNIMETPRGIRTAIQPTTSKCSVSSTTIKIANPDNIISRWFYERQTSDNTMTYGEKVEIYACGLDLVPVLIYVGIIRTVTNDKWETYYEFEIADFQDRLKTSLFDRELSEYSTESLSDINTYRLPFYMDDTVRKGFEIIEVDDGEEDDNNDPIMTRVITFTGHVIDFVEMIYQLTFSTDTLDTQIGYLSTEWENFVDTDSLDSVRLDLDSTTYQFYFEFREPIDDPYAFLTENIYQPCAIFPYVNATGKLGMKLHKQPETGESVTVLDKDNILEINSKKISDENVVNHIKVKYGWKFKDDEESVIRYFGNSASYNKFRMFIPQDAPQEFDVKGINKLSPTDRATFAQNLVDAIFARYALPSTTVEVTVPLEISTDWKVGDYLYIAHDGMIAWEGDNYGYRGIGENVDEDFVDPWNGIAYCDVDINWGAFVTGNKLGTAIDSHECVTTDHEIIESKLFNEDIENDFFSCLENHRVIDAWLDSQVVPEEYQDDVYTPDDWEEVVYVGGIERKLLTFATTGQMQYLYNWEFVQLFPNDETMWRKMYYYLSEDYIIIPSTKLALATKIIGNSSFWQFGTLETSSEATSSEVGIEDVYLTDWDKVIKYKSGTPITATLGTNQATGTSLQNIDIKLHPDNMIQPSFNEITSTPWGTYTYEFQLGEVKIPRNAPVKRTVSSDIQNMDYDSSFGDLYQITYYVYPDYIYIPGQRFRWAVTGPNITDQPSGTYRYFFKLADGDETSMATVSEPVTITDWDGTNIQYKPNGDPATVSFGIMQTPRDDDYWTGQGLIPAGYNVVDIMFDYEGIENYNGYTQETTDPPLYQLYFGDVWIPRK